MKKLILLITSLLFSFIVYSHERPKKSVYAGKAIISNYASKMDFDDMNNRELFTYLYENTNMIRPINISPQDTTEKKMSNYEKYRMKKEREEHPTLYSKNDTIYITDTVYIEVENEQSNANNYYNNSFDMRSRLYFGYRPFYSYSYYDPFYYNYWGWNYPYYSYNYRYGYNYYDPYYSYNYGYRYNYYAPYYSNYYSNGNYRNSNVNVLGQHRRSYNPYRNSVNVTNVRSGIISKNPTPKSTRINMNKTITIDRRTNKVLNTSVTQRTTRMNPKNTYKNTIIQNHSTSQNKRRYIPSYKNTKTGTRSVYNNSNYRTNIYNRRSTPTLKSSSTHRSYSPPVRSSGRSYSPPVRSSGRSYSPPVRSSGRSSSSRSSGRNSNSGSRRK